MSVLGRDDWARLDEIPSVRATTGHRTDSASASDYGAGRLEELPPIENAATRLAHPAELPADVIDGLLHRAGKMVLGGGSKSNKTWMLVDMAISVANGLPWLGYSTRPGRVLYINLEIPAAFFDRRLTRICEARGIDLSMLANVDIWNLRGHAADAAVLVPLILEHIANRDYALIIIDPIYKLGGGRDENLAGDTTALLNELERLAVHSGAAVVFGAHFPKGNQAGKEPMDRIAGSGVYARDPDSILVVTRHEEEDAFTVDAVLRNHAPLEPCVVRWEFPLMVRDGDLDPARLKVPARSIKKYSADQLLVALGKDSLRRDEWFQRVQAQTQMTETTFDRLRKELVKEGKIEGGGHHAPWRRVIDPGDAASGPEATIQAQETGGAPGGN